MDPQGRRVKIHREEMESLLNLKSKLDHEEAVFSHAAAYQKLGWVLQALNPQDGAFLAMDAGAGPETWVNRLWEKGLPGPEINLGVQTGKRSRLMILEVAKGPGEAILEPVWAVAGRVYCRLGSRPGTALLCLAAVTLL